MAEMLIPDFRIGEELKEGENRYQFVLAVSKRANDVNAKEELREKCGDENVVTYALKEFMSKKLEINPDCPPEQECLTQHIDVDDEIIEDAEEESAEAAEEIIEEVAEDIAEDAEVTEEPAVESETEEIPAEQE